MTDTAPETRRAGLVKALLKVKEDRPEGWEKSARQICRAIQKIDNDGWEFSYQGNECDGRRGRAVTSCPSFDEDE